MLFEKFGEFDSAEELNRAAAAQLAEGDIDAIYGIAEENGIDREDAEDYIDGAAPELCTPIMAALGKLKAAPSSFLKSIDFTIASGTATKNILLADIPDAGEIVCAGLVSRGWEGWNALNVTYTTESVTITFSTSNNSGNAYGSEIVRVWYR